MSPLSTAKVLISLIFSNVQEQIEAKFSKMNIFETGTNIHFKEMFRVIESQGNLIVGSYLNLVLKGYIFRNKRSITFRTFIHNNRQYFCPSSVG